MYMYLAIRRSKDNADKQKQVFRSFSMRMDGDELIAGLKARTSIHPGVWRIYRSVNRRDETKAKLKLAQTLMAQLVLPMASTMQPPDALWKSLLMNPENKAERLFLVDIDTKISTEANEVISALGGLGGGWIKKKVKTPNGYHLVTEPFNPKTLLKHKCAEIKKDALLFLEQYTVE